MKIRDGEQRLLQQVSAQLADPLHADNPLRETLEALYRQHCEQREQVARLMSISDRYQALAREAEKVVQQRYERELRRQRKLSRISDGYQAMIRERSLRLDEEAHHDALTTLPNRRLLYDHLARLDRDGKEYALVLLDIDHFKQINDTYGHDVGDELLVAIACAMRDSLRDGDVCGRWGGEEFLVLLHETRLEDAARLVDRLLDQLSQVCIACGNHQLSATLSAGVSERDAGESYAEALQRADQALLDAKRCGRNRSQLALPSS